MKFNFHNPENKAAVFDQIQERLLGMSMIVDGQDKSKPWGGAFYIGHQSVDIFVERFFPELPKDSLYRYGDQLQPKVLVVAPDQKLSWQYHHRRAEIWKNLGSAVGILISRTNEQPDRHTVLETGGTVMHEQLVRHRLVGLDQWGVLAEIWQHTDPKHLSDENDIVRLEDSYGRS